MKRILSILLIILFIPNLAIAKIPASPTLPTIPEDIEEVIEDYQPIFQITIYYLYLNGEQVFPTYNEHLYQGTPYEVFSPEKEGYIRTIELITGIMPARDIEYVVFYIPQGKTIIRIGDYEVPLGINTFNMHVGICVE